MEITMIAVLNRLILQLALGVAFGAGQVILAMVTAPVPVASRGTQFQPTVTATTIATTPALPAPVGAGWG
jgi:hypothetical protein